MKTLLLLALAAPALARKPQGAPLLPPEALREAVFFGKAGVAELLPEPDRRLGPVASAASTGEAAAPRDLGLTVLAAGGASQGDALLGRFWARCAGRSGCRAKVEFLFGRAQDPEDNSVRFLVEVGPKWREYSVPFSAHRAYVPGEARAALHFGFGEQEVEVAGVETLNYRGSVSLRQLPLTRVDYPGRDWWASWRKQARERIDLLRKAELAVVVRDAEGLPVPNAKVHLRMERHAFRFGAAASADSLAAQDEEGRRYRNSLLRYFNAADVAGASRGGAQWLASNGLEPAAPGFVRAEGFLEDGAPSDRRREEFIAELKSRGDGAAAGIALDARFRWLLTAPERVLEVLDRFGALGRPLAISSFGVDNPDPALQADYTRDFLTAAFSHPLVASISLADFRPDPAARAQSGLFQDDWKLKPNGKAFEELVLREWWTDETGYTDSTGRFALRAFLGRYRITVRRKARVAVERVELTKQGAAVEAVLD